MVASAISIHSVANKKVALSALGEILLRNVVKKVDNAKITSNQPYATHPLFLDNLHFDEIVK
jgi:hypothetical protein